MDCASPILDIAMRLWDSCANRATLILDLDQILNSLRDAMEELKDLREDVKRRIELAEQQQVKKQVEGWLKRVEILEQQVNQILQNGEVQVQSKCFAGHCPKNCYSTHKAAQKTVKMIGKVKEEISKGCFDGVADESPCVLVDEKPVDKTVGLECALDEAWSLVEKPEMGILGLYGMGGVGKTTLLTKINNEFLKRRHQFDLVIWIVVARQARVEQVQEAIRNRVNIEDTRWNCKGEDEKAAAIYKHLKKKRFVLLLDDVWEHLDLLKVGIPLPDLENKCKVVFTTRSQEVCSQMEAHRRIKVTCLAKREALTLFNQKVGEETLSAHPEIPSLAKVVAKECDGLPLALITIGRAMSGKKDPREWRRAIEVLKSYPSRISGMGDHVFPVLKFSYDSLHDDTLKNCFLYCSVFPEDYNIPKSILVELWIGEGFIDESHDIHEARNLGFDILESLKLACLLEAGNSANAVKMHDVIRDMALWLACTNGTNRHQIVVEERARLIDSLMFAKWKLAERISLWGATSISGTPSCTNLITLFVKNCKLMKLPSQFFHCMPSIRVLDLSNSELTELPVEIKKLTNLWYLNLSFTRVMKLPRDLGSLTEMRHLLLDFMEELKVIPHQLIPKFLHMRVLSMMHCGSDIQLDEAYKGNVLSGGKEVLLEEIEQLEYLSDLCINISRAHYVQKLLSSEKFQRCIRWLCLERCQGLTEIILPSSSIQQIKNLEKLELKYCRQLNQIKILTGNQGNHWAAADNSYGSLNNRNQCFASLSSVIITDCQLVELTWLMYVPCLESLHVRGCKLLEEVISDNPVIQSTEELHSMFRRLKTILLFDLPNLKCLSPRPLPFPSLEEMKVMLCPNLRKLPFDSNTRTDILLRIEGWPSWWGNLQWEDENIKLTFQAFFHASN